MESGKRVVKGYELRERVGVGGFGEVYRAYQPAIGREVAVKIILPQHANQPDFIRRFEVEAQLVARLEHPHIVPLYDYWRDPSGAYLVLRWLPHNLRASMERGPWSPLAAARFLDQITSALTVAHRDNVIHRDIKPENILLDEDENAYLADFGIAKDLSVRQTAEDDFAGSPAYSSPEQIRSQELTARSDLYSLGYVLYELLTGEKAFPEAQTPSDYIQKHLTAVLPLVSTRHKHLPAALDEVLQTATAKEPAHRYANARRFAAAFRAALPDVLPRFQAQPLVEPLTERELEVLHLIIAGLSNEQICERLFLSATTVKWYLRQIYGKLDVHSRHQAIDRAKQLRLTESHAGPAAPPEALDSAPAGVKEAAAVPWVEPVNPYKGLRAFQEADAADFFGRASLVEQLLNRLSEAGDSARFLAVVGPSGSGKSSVVNAGLIPALRQGALVGSPRPFIAEMMPGTHPLEELEAALLRVAVNPLPSLLEQLRSDRRGLVRAAKRVLPGDPNTELFLIVDQFEELFTLVTDDGVRTHFIDNLLAAATDPRGRVRVVFTLRADFYDRPLLYPRLAELVRSHTELVLPMSARELDQAITGPAERAGVRLESGLVATIITEIGEQPGALPLLQYALTELFERREGLILTLDAYQASGGVVGALARRADELYADLTEDEQAAARQLFLRLVTLGEGTEDTRRRTLQAELLATSADSTMMEEIITTFSQYRLLTLDRDPITRGPTVEVAHEALIRQWERLRQWLMDSRDDIRLQRALSQAASEWERAESDPSYLLSGARLAQYEAWVEATDLALTGIEHAYVEASLEERQRQAAVEAERQAREVRLERRSRTFLRGLVAVLTLALVISGTLAVVAFDRERQAQAARNDAVDARATSVANFARAEQQRLYLAAENAMDDNATGNVGMALALRSLAYGYMPGADAALIRTTRQGYVRHEWAASQSDLNNIAYSPDGSLIAASGEGSALILNSTTGEVMHTLTQAGVVTSSVFSPLGTYLLTTGNNPVVRLWDVQTGEHIRSFVDRENTHFAYFSQDGSQVIVQNMAAVQVWDTETGSRIERYPRGRSEGASVFAYLQRTANSYFVIRDSANHIFLEDAASGENRCVLLDSGIAPSMLWWSEQLPYLVIAAMDNLAHAWNFETCTPLATFSGHTSRVLAGDYDPNTHSMVTVDSSRFAYQWSLDTGSEIARFVGAGQVSSVDIAPDGLRLIMPDVHNVAVWDMTVTPEPREIPAGYYSSPYLPRFSPDGNSLLVGGFGRYARWDLNSTATTPVFTFEQPLRTLDFSPDGRTLIAGLETPGQDEVLLLDAETGVVLRTFEGHRDAVNFIDVSRSGRQFASGSFDNTARSWDIATGDAIQVFRGHEGGVSSAVFSPDESLLVTTSTDGTARLWDALTGEQLHVFEVGEAVIYADFSPDGRLITASDTAGFAHIWDVATKTELHRLSGHTAAIWTALFSPDGTQIVTSSWDGTARVWDAASGDTIRVLDSGRGRPLYWAEFSPDGNYVVTGASRMIGLIYGVSISKRLSLPSVIGHWRT